MLKIASVEEQGREKTGNLGLWPGLGDQMEIAVLDTGVFSPAVRGTVKMDTHFSYFSENNVFTECQPLPYP